MSHIEEKRKHDNGDTCKSKDNDFLISNDMDKLLKSHHIFNVLKGRWLKIALSEKKNNDVSVTAKTHLSLLTPCLGLWPLQTPNKPKKQKYHCQHQQKGK